MMLSLQNVMQKQVFTITPHTCSHCTLFFCVLENLILFFSFFLYCMDSVRLSAKFSWQDNLPSLCHVKMNIIKVELAQDGNNLKSCLCIDFNSSCHPVLIYVGTFQRHLFSFTSISNDVIHVLMYIVSKKMMMLTLHLMLQRGLVFKRLHTPCNQPVLLRA